MFNLVTEFEKLVSDYFGSKYAVATDCCTHALELCLRYSNVRSVTCPTHTYISVPFTFKKLNLRWYFEESSWQDYYFLGNTNIIDAAVLWKENSYVPGTFMCLSFQFKKHLGLGRGGMILLDNEDAYRELSKMRYDGRDLTTPWAEQNISSMGYHYYMTPEIAEVGIKKFQEVKDLQPKQWSYTDYPYLPNMDIFKK